MGDTGKLRGLLWTSLLIIFSYVFSFNFLMDFYLFVDFELEFWFLYLLGHAHVSDDASGGASLGGVPEVNYYYYQYSTEEKVK